MKIENKIYIIHAWIMTLKKNWKEMKELKTSNSRNEEKPWIRKTMKITLVTKREVDFEGQDGQNVKGFMYIGFLPDGRGIEFFSRDTHTVNEGLIGYEKSFVEDLVLVPKMGKNSRIKYSEKTD